MERRRSPFSQANVTRAVRGRRCGGLECGQPEGQSTDWSNRGCSRRIASVRFAIGCARIVSAFLAALKVG